MNTIVIGKINDNKTTTMIELYKKRGTGDGFVSIKHMIQDTVHSYDAMQLSTHEQRVFIKRDIFYEDDFTVCCKLGPYYFSDETMAWIKETMLTLAGRGVTPLYLDEIGVLELENKGFHDLLKTLRSMDVDLVLSVREDLVDAIINHYNLEEVTLIKSTVKRTDIDV
ncbi:MAG: nucleoside-triphosphatase [Bacillota bacterium]